jgi:hypothetical protein
MFKPIKGRRYWYSQSATAAGRSPRHIGPESPQLIERIAHHQTGAGPPARAPATGVGPGPVLWIARAARANRQSAGGFGYSRRLPPPGSADWHCPLPRSGRRLFLRAIAGAASPAQWRVPGSRARAARTAPAHVMLDPRLGHFGGVVGGNSTLPPREPAAVHSPCIRSHMWLYFCS